MANLVTNQVYDYLIARPWSTALEIAAAIGEPRSRIASSIQSLKLNRAFRVEDRLSNAKRSASNQKLMEYRVIPHSPALQQEVTPTAINFGLDSLIDGVAKQIAYQLAVRIHQNLIQELGSFLIDSLSITSAPEIDLTGVLSKIKEASGLAPKPVASRLPTVGVVGLLPIQFGELVSEFSGCLELKFADKDSVAEVKALTGCDAVFAHVRHMSHSVDEILKNSKVSYHRVSGGTSNMKKAILEYYANQ